MSQLGTPATTDGASSEARAVREQEESRLRTAHLAQRLRMALTFGAIIFPSFVVSDFSALAATRYGTQPADLLVPRFVMSALIALGAVWLRRTPQVTSRQLVFLEQALYTLAGVTISVMALSLGGLHSVYIPGLCLILTARTFAVSHPWREGLRSAIIPTFGPLIVLVAGVAIRSDLRAQLSDLPTIIDFSIQASQTIGTSLLMVTGGHIVDALRTEITSNKDIGRYKLRRRIGEGGMGEVWAAYHQSLRREVALKLLRAAPGSLASATVRFEREVRATTELTHPNTVRVFDYGVTEQGVMYYAMELLRGGTLMELVTAEGKFPPARAVYVVTQAARALAEAHARGIVHRDLKPENLFITHAGTQGDFVKVLDFGVARFDDDDGALTGADVLVGTPRYMAPEVARGAVANAGADVWALCGVLHFALTGRSPLDANSRVAMLSALLDPAPVPLLPAGLCSPELSALVERGLQKDPKQRFVDASELAAALDRVPEARKWEPAPVSLDGPQTSPVVEKLRAHLSPESMATAEMKRPA